MYGTYTSDFLISVTGKHISNQRKFQFKEGSSALIRQGRRVFDKSRLIYAQRDLRERYETTKHKLQLEILLPVCEKKDSGSYLCLWHQYGYIIVQ